MVQQEIKKKTRIYGTVAALSAIVLVGLIFAFGSTPVLTPGTNPTTTPIASAMKTFTSVDELRNYITANSQGTSSYAGGPLDSKFFGDSRVMWTRPAEPAPTEASPGSYGMSTGGYSTTNIQVAGVDEADTVKTDGTYIYVASNDYANAQNHVYIVKADPSDPRVIAKITLENNTYLAGIYLSEDGNKLVVIGSEYQIYALGIAAPASDAMIYPYRSEVRTFLSIYDITDKVHPQLARNFTLTGSYFNSRMIGDYVYAVVSQQAYVVEGGTVPLPKVYSETGEADVAPTQVYYSDKAYYADVATNYFTYTTFFGLNVKDASEEPANMTVLMGGASTMYVSLGNIYVTYPSWTSENGEYTSIYRIRIDKNALTFEAKGSVWGYVLNQYSMDEYNGYFRLATTSTKNTTQNNVYVLNMNLTAVGKLENLAVTERIYSARFMGDKGYLVTFRQVDPFFVLDLHDPANPKVAGELKIPGYSSYLHPYDENHVIGVGMENSSVKLSLFDVTNINAPTEIARYTVQGDYSSTDVLYEPKAFLFDKARQLLVIPVSITQYGVVGGGAVPPTGKEGLIAPTQGGYWQGALVFKLTLEGGFELRGGITHQETATNQTYYYYGDYNLYVTRSLYIGNTLYTVSNGKVALNSLTDLAPIAAVKLS